jgi:lipopolysaccharide export system permease protein
MLAAMLLIDRYILTRFATNFVILFLLLFIFAATIDLILNLDRFIDAGRAKAGAGAGFMAVAISFFAVAGDFQLPRVFQFYAFLHGLVAIGAMAFTLAQMHKCRELVAMMASGMSLYRVALPFVMAVFVLSVIQLVNQETMLPRVAPLLLRDHGQIGKPTVNEFEVRLAADSRGNLMHAPTFNPATNTLIGVTILERDERGLTTRRIVADRAAWDASASRWMLENGYAYRLRAGDDRTTATPFVREPIESYQTDLSPEILTVKRHDEFASMLSLAQISRMLEAGGVADVRALLRYRYSRFATVCVNLFVLALALPCFLLREPANLLRQSLLCAAVTIPSMLGAAIGMMVDLPGIPPAAGVMLPVVILGFLAVVPWTNFRT